MFDRDKDGFIDTDEFKTVTPMKMKITFINPHRFRVFVCPVGGSLLPTNKLLGIPKQGIFLTPQKRQGAKK